MPRARLKRQYLQARRQKQGSDVHDVRVVEAVPAGQQAEACSSRVQVCMMSGVVVPGTSAVGHQAVAHQQVPNKPGCSTPAGCPANQAAP